MAKGKDKPAHLWQKGQTGNPNGRPKGAFSISRELRKQLGEVDPDDPQGRTHGEVMCARALWLANYGPNKQGSIKAIAEVADRAEGKPVQVVLNSDDPASKEEKLRRAVEIFQNLKRLQDDASDTIQ